MTNLVERLRFESPGPNHIALEAADEIIWLREELLAAQEEAKWLRKSNNAAKTLVAAKERIQLATGLDQKVVEEAKDTLQSERDANAQLTEELLAAQVRISELREAIYAWQDHKSDWFDEALSHTDDLSALRDYRSKVLMDAAEWYGSEHPVGVQLRRMAKELK